MRAKLSDAGIAVAPLSGADLRSFLRPQAALYRDIVKAAKISME